ncbi:hypothetical protein [Paenibacillus harenae]|uniref:Vacuolar-type H+-ATPase subunit I/STV1 n=1 Tax=Paenibacillus harenae TaxID=306543 RepID=A0ABT9TTJ1_PAEHA|nr:hypothetical protein [Paenibacillus harenae]MDQ0110670.1 vacuolar-type H+-ATPase subunit I/STV1 [Paenibacillus harenae]
MKKGKHVPNEVRKSFILWLIAIGAGVFEMIIAIITSLSEASEDGLVIQALIRTIIFALLTVVIISMYRGKRWARIALTVLLGGIGALSLLIDPIMWLIEGNPLSTIFEGVVLTSLLFAASRVVHLAAVIAALVFMFRPAANQYFRPA